MLAAWRLLAMRVAAIVVGASVDIVNLLAFTTLFEGVRRWLASVALY